ncbi:helix-turn-helix domain-containing protein [Novosphingobium sp. AP12]|uniref:winged helix-turn-helix transcriptional regulator n=1 Tax=Novosphingobium sp. AP12 TaxID=1144305 RepID=UPI000271E30F|nr:helix-turn-helix domain-containing protein [Novosphingobium sp. AP12]EJL20254.1 putative transcriptional regulator [Novosphingobium sp. AP12]
MERSDLLGLLGSRWALHILMALADGPMRFTDLRAALPAISAKVLTARLRELEANALVARLQFRSPMPGQGYGLSAAAQDLRPALDQIRRWTSARALTGASC